MQYWLVLAVAVLGALYLWTSHRQRVSWRWARQQSEAFRKARARIWDDGYAVGYMDGEVGHPMGQSENPYGTDHRQQGRRS